jgi:hypothetical protein
VVVLADGRLHDVRHRGAAVHDDPFAVLLAFDARLRKARLAHRVTHAGSERLGLAIGRARRHDHPLEQRRQVLGVENLDVMRLDVFEAVDDGSLEFLRVFLGGGVLGHQVGW